MKFPLITTSLLFLIACWLNVSSQVMHDNHWIISNYIHFQFDSNELHADIIPHPLQGLITNVFNTAMSSKEGELLFHSGGCFIMDRNSNIMENGDSLNPGILELGYCMYGDHIWYQDVLILPYPDTENKYLLFTLDIGVPFPFGDTTYYPFVPLHLYSHIVDMTANNGMGKVISKNQVAVSDTLSRGYVQACKHANGRDWWVIIPEWNSNCYYILYVDPGGNMNHKKICSGPNFIDFPDFGGEVNFSPNGLWYARSEPWVNDTVGKVHLFSFDRCNGDLNYTTLLTFPTEFPYYTGLTFSPNSNYLYITSNRSLWQFDLSNSNIQTSRNLSGEIRGDFTPEKGTLYFQQIAPDGKIYIGSPLGHNYLSTIHYPNRKGIECGFKEHDFPMPLLRQNYAGLSNYPNYRLGSNDESTCDTLGIDNIPIANFRYERDSINPLKINFINLSYFEPTDFVWEFDDAEMDDAENPSHTFPNNGIYNVCLTASNNNGQHTFCREISIASTAVTNFNSHSLSVTPNPASNFLQFHFKEPVSTEFEISLVDLLGVEVLTTIIYSNDSSIDISNIPAGNYFLKIASADPYQIQTQPLFIIR